jgi:hypothetical protein
MIDKNGDTNLNGDLRFTKERAWTIGINDSTNAVVGATLTILGAAGGTGTAGGPVNITGGAAGSGVTTGGAITLTTGGGIASGSISLVTPAALGTAGGINLTTGASSGGNSILPIAITGGNNTGSGNAGSITLTGGTNSSTGNAGSITLNAGAGTKNSYVLLNSGGVGYVGISTTSPRRALTIASSTASQLMLADGSRTSSPWNFRSINGNLFIATSSPTTFATSSIAALTINIKGNVGVATTSPNGLFSIGTTTPGTSKIALDVGGRLSRFNSSGDGSVGPWVTGSAMSTSTSQVIEANGYVYALDGSADTGKTVFDVAPINADGSLGTWRRNQYSIPASHPSNTTVVAYNGYIYALGGCNGAFCLALYSDVYYAKLNPDGSTGPWKATTALSEVRHGGVALAANGYLYYQGGSNASSGTKTTLYSKINADGTVGSWATATGQTNGTKYQQAAAIANGYLYVVGGWDKDYALFVNASSTVQYAPIKANGDIGTFTTATNNMPGGRGATRAAVANGKLYVVGGESNLAASNSQSTVFYTTLKSNGDVSAWTTNVQNFPSARAGMATLVANGYLYVLGGVNTSQLAQTTVYYGSLARTQFAGTLDLLGLNTSGPLSGLSGDAGSSILAGSGFFANRLQVSGNTELWNGLSVMGPSSFLAGTTTQSSPFFNIGTSTSKSFFSVLGNGYIGVGTSTPRRTLTVASSTGSQLMLTDAISGANTTNTPWNFRAKNGNLYFATSSLSTFATSTIAADC